MKGLIVEADYIITCNPESSIIRDGAVYIEENKIKAIGKRREISNYYAADKIIKGSSKILLPGLVNTHSHSVQTLLRGKADDLELLDWLQKIILPGEMKLTADDIYLSCLVGFAEMIRSGTTTCNDMLTTHDSERGIEAAITSGIRARIGKMLMDTDEVSPPEMIESSDKIIRTINEHIKKYHNIENGRIKYSLNPRFLLSCSPELIRELVKIRDNNQDILLHTHAAENQSELNLVKKIFGDTYIRSLNSLNALGEKTILAHGIWLDEEEYLLLQKTKTKISHNPSSNSKLASGIADITKMHAMGIEVGLATDGAPCNNNLDMFREMRLASFLQKIKHLDEKALPAKKVLRMGTIEGARILHLDHEIGSIEVGKKADLIMVDISEPNALPLYDPISHIVYSADGKDVSMTMIDGKIVYQNGEFYTIDIKRLNEDVTKFVEKMSI